MITPIIVPMKVSTDSTQIRMKLGVAYSFVEGDHYEGQTTVEPILFSPVVLQTKKKVLEDNITVLPITILDVDNPAGGYTVTIGAI